jgi:hypothetical protein
MRGFVQSLNVSVAAAVSLAHAVERRERERGRQGRDPEGRSSARGSVRVHPRHSSLRRFRGGAPTALSNAGATPGLAEGEVPPCRAAGSRGRGVRPRGPRSASIGARRRSIQKRERALSAADREAAREAQDGTRGTDDDRRSGADSRAGTRRDAEAAPEI